MQKILFFIRSLNAGGAERQLVLTAKALSGLGHSVTVLTFYDGGVYANELSGTRVQLVSLQKNGRWDVIFFLLRLRRVLCDQSADAIYSFLVTANIFSVVMRPFIPATRLVWGVRASDMDLEQYDWLARLSYWTECRFARFANAIVANSNAGMKYAIVNGFPKEKMVVVPNGIDANKFRPDKAAGKQLREAWGVSENEKLIGVVGRIDPMKGIPTFLEAAKILKNQNSNIRFVWVGTGEENLEKSMCQLASKSGLDDVLIWAGRHSDMVAVYNAFDIASSSSSYGEGFPNVLGEAMACGVPCVVTNVGDSALVVGDIGAVVPVKDSQALVVAWNNLLMLNDEEIQEKKTAARSRVVNKFSVAKMISSTEAVLDGRMER